MEKRRVAITGLGLVTPLGIGVEANLNALMNAVSGIGTITRFDSAEFPSKIAGEVKGFDPLQWVSKREIKTIDRFLQFAIAAGASALADSGLPERFPDEISDRVGCYVGAGWGGLETVQKNFQNYSEKGPRFGFSPYTVSASLINLAPGQLSIRHNIQGPAFSHVSACATGAHSIGEAMRAIQWDVCDVVLAGGTEAPIEILGVGGFGAARALSTRNHEPQLASRPFDKNRDGFVIAEGAGILVLEEMEYARSRGARIYAELLGYGASSDAHHVTEPQSSGAGAQRCIRAALKDAQIKAEQIGHINAHGTSTKYNDAAETQAIKAVFGEYAARIPISSTKSMTGHTLGAAGAIEAAFCALNLTSDCLFPTINYETPDPECDLDYVPNVARKQKVDYVLSNSFGFGGTNAALILGRAAA
jgi:3-oxoacyl-[acyl-carrier-protein] synthase II